MSDAPTIWQMFWNPDAMPRDPLAWIGNQAAHVLIVGGLIVALLGALRWRLWVGALVYGVWEAWHWLLTFDWLDSLTDWAFVVAGMALMRASWTGNRHKLLLAYAGVIIAGAVGMGMRA